MIKEELEEPFLYLPPRTNLDKIDYDFKLKTRSSWLNCASRDDEAVYWVSIGHYVAVAVGN